MYRNRRKCIGTVGNIGSAEIVTTVEIQKVKDMHVRRTGEIAGSKGTTSNVEN